jgi:predicted RNA-binding protein with PIN domain
MSLCYIVDGYNLIKRSGRFDDDDLRTSRQKFFAYLEACRPQGSLRNSLSIVFDGSADVVGFREDRSFEVIFTRGESADEKIKSMVQASGRPKDCIVVTDDRDLAIFVRRCGARVMGTLAFTEKGAPVRPRSKNASAGADTSSLNIVEREKITREMERLWLKKK